MRKTEPPIAANATHAPGMGLDRAAVEKARRALRDIPHHLPQSQIGLLAQEVISRMAEQHRSPQKRPPETARALADALAAPDDAAAMRAVMRLLAGGESVETVYLTHLAGAARVLGLMWEGDSLSSAQVTIAAARIYAIMRGIASRLTPDAWPDGRHAVFATVPGERHTLGVSMAADLFRRDGWLIDLKVGRSHDDLLDELAESDFATLVLAATTASVLPDLTRLVAALRIAAPHAAILVAGRLARIVPDLAAQTDACAATDDIDEARRWMAARVTDRPREESARS